MHRPRDEARLFQFAELEGQHFLGDVAHTAFEFTEPLGSARQMPEQEQLPLAPHQIHREFQRTGVLLFELFHRISLSIFSDTIR